MPYLEVFQDKSKLVRRWRWRRRSANHRTIAGPQQGYTRRASAVRSARKNFPDDGDPKVLS